MDYYELLGVDVDAPVDDIRAAYRDKKAAVAEQGTDDAKADAAALNKAWNVLSDPYQRGRYDQQLADSDGTEGDDEDEDDDAAPVVRKRAAKPASRTESRRGGREPLKPTVKLPAGTHFPATRQRLIAMAIDVVMLIALFLVGWVGIVPKLEKSQHPAAYEAVRKLTDKDTGAIVKAQDATKAANKTATAADKAYADLLKTKGANDADTQTASTAKKSADDALQVAKADEKAVNKEYDKQAKVLEPLQKLVTAGFFLVSLLVLIVPSLFGGQTLGKRTQKIRVIRMDGSPVRPPDVIRRYGALVLAGYALSYVLGPVGALAVVFVATMWTRNANLQGLQDRFAKTLVVADDEA